MLLDVDRSFFGAVMFLVVIILVVGVAVIYSDNSSEASFVGKALGIMLPLDTKPVPCFTYKGGLWEYEVLPKGDGGRVVVLLNLGSNERIVAEIVETPPPPTAIFVVFVPGGIEKLTIQLLPDGNVKFTKWLIEMWSEPGSYIDRGYTERVQICETNSEGDIVSRRGFVRTVSGREETHYRETMHCGRIIKIKQISNDNSGDTIIRRELYIIEDSQGNLLEIYEICYWNGQVKYIQRGYRSDDGAWHEEYIDEPAEIPPLPSQFRMDNCPEETLIPPTYEGDVPEGPVLYSATSVGARESGGKTDDVVVNKRAIVKN